MCSARFLVRVSGEYVTESPIPSDTPRMQDKIKARLFGDLNPDEWDLPPKPKRIRWATYKRFKDAKLLGVMERLLRRSRMGAA